MNEHVERRWLRTQLPREVDQMLLSIDQIPSPDDEELSRQLRKLRKDAGRHAARVKSQANLAMQFTPGNPCGYYEKHREAALKAMKRLRVTEGQAHLVAGSTLLFGGR